MRRQALRVALSEKIRDDALIILDSLSLPDPKSSIIKDMINAFDLKGRTLIVIGSTDHNVVKSANNIPGIEVQAAALINPLETVSTPNLIITQDALVAIDSLWGETGGKE
jgi:large subunit ribosomal protein L4